MFRIKPENISFPAYLLSVAFRIFPIYETEIIHKSGQHFGKELEPLFLVIIRDKLMERFFSCAGETLPKVKTAFRSNLKRIWLLG